MRGKCGMQAIIGAAILAGAAAAPAASLPEPQLRLAPMLKPPPADSVRPDERAVLRLEWRAGQSRADEAAVLDDMIARLDRIGASVAELHAVIEAMPPGQPPAAPAGACESVAEEREPPWLAVAAGVVLVALAGWIWRRRRRPPDPAFEPTVLVLPTSATNVPPPVEARAETARAPHPVLPAAAKATPSNGKTTPAEIPAKAPASDSAFETRPIIADADESLELVDIMVSMGLNQGAAETLEEHIRRHPRQALYHWLKLLDVFRRSGREAEFERAAGELRQHFNVMPDDWRAADSAFGHSRLEDYPHILARLQELWRHKNCEDYLTRLLQDNRGGTRAGFPQPVAEEILLLLSIVRS